MGKGGTSNELRTTMEEMEVGEEDTKEINEMMEEHSAEAEGGRIGGC